jgi:hypothetical protein
LTGKEKRLSLRHPISYTLLDVPGSTFTIANGINDAGQIVGGYGDAGGIVHSQFEGNDRKTDPAKLSRLVRGELDWVVMRCLEKDRTHRYDIKKPLSGASSTRCPDFSSPNVIGE